MLRLEKILATLCRGSPLLSELTVLHVVEPLIHPVLNSLELGASAWEAHDTSKVMVKRWSSGRASSPAP